MNTPFNSKDFVGSFMDFIMQELEKGLYSIQLETNLSCEAYDLSAIVGLEVISL